MRKTHLRRIGVILAGMCIFIGGMEIYLRMIHYADPPHHLLPDGTPTKGNPYEDRNRYPDDPFTGETYNIVIFGGAWPFGLGCSSAETFAGIMENELREKRNLAVRVVNMGQPDFSTKDVAEIFPRSLKRYKADLAVIMTGLRDCIPDYLEGDFSARKPFSVASDAALPRWRISRLWSNDRFYRFLKARNIDPEDRKDYVVRRLSLAETQTFLLEIAKAARDADVKTIFITYPKLECIDRAYPHYPLYSRRNFLAKTAASSFGHMIVDLEEKIPAQDTAKFLLPWMRWPHPNARGHQFIADEILTAVSEDIKRVPRI